MTDATIVAITQSKVDGIQTPEEFIAYAARVSNPGNQMNNETSLKLVKYLMKNKHWSPFEMASVTMEINTTRDIARQLLRHSMKYQEFSQRYADASELGFVIREARMQDTKNRQNSLPMVDSELAREWEFRQQEVIDLVRKNYDWALANGLAKEQARVILPEGNTKSRLYVAGNVRNWFHYTQVRMDPSTQKEHRDLATDCFKALQKEFPNIFIDE